MIFLGMNYFLKNYSSLQPDEPVVEDDEAEDDDDNEDDDKDEDDVEGTQITLLLVNKSF